MFKESPFCIETNSGKIELTKGNFLALQKRKQSTLRTLAKTKPIAKECSKSTVKRSSGRSSSVQRSDEVGLFNKCGEEVRFAVSGEGERLRWRMLKSLPSIEMSYDNDEES